MPRKLILNRARGGPERPSLSSYVVALARRVLALEQRSQPRDGAPGRDGHDGRGLADYRLTDAGELVVIFDDRQERIVGRVVGRDGRDGRDGTDGAAGADGRDGRGIADYRLTDAGELVVIFDDRQERIIG